MIRVNGIPLDNPAMGWILRPDSVPYSALTAGTTALERTGRDGDVPTPSTLSSPVWRLQVNTPPAGFDALQNLLNTPDLLITRDDRPGWETHAKLATSSIDRIFPRNEWIDVSFYVTIPGAFMRAVASETATLTITAATHQLSCFAARPVGQVAQWRNLLTNPGFESGAGTVVVRTNWIRNSNFETDASLWTTTNAATQSRSTAQAHRGSASLQVVTAGTTSGEGIYSSTYTIPGVVAGTPYAASVWVLAPAGATMEALANTVGTGGTVPVVPFTGTGAWQFISLPNNLANSGLAPYILVRTRGTAQAITFYVDEAILETGVSTVGPYFDAVSQPILRTNLADVANRQALVATLVDGVSYLGSTWTRATPNDTTPLRGVRHNIPLNRLTNGAIYRWVVEVANDGTQPVTINLDWCDLLPVTTATIQPGERRFVGLNAARATYDATYRFADLAITSTAQQSILYRTPMIEQTAAATDPFDGNGVGVPQGFSAAFTGAANASPSIMWDADFSTRWQGTVNASASELTGVGVAGYTPNLGTIAVRSSRWFLRGSYSIRLIASGASNNTYVDVGNGTTPPTQANTQYTVIATRHLEAPLTGALSAQRGCVSIYNGTWQNSPIPANVAGENEARLTASTAAYPSGSRVMLHHGGAAGSGDVWWDLATLVAGTYTGPAFTGATTPPDHLNVIAWDGLPDQSSSTWTVFGSWDGGLSAPIQDAVLRLKGPATGIQVTDSSGAWVILPDTPAGTWSRFEADTGQCFQTTTDTWSGGTEVSGLVDFGGPRDVFEITPVMVPGDPGSRGGQLTVSTATRPGAPVFEVRGKAAYLL